MSWFHGPIVVLCLTVANQSQLELMQYQETQLGYYQPTLTCWFNHGALVLYLFLALAIRACRLSKRCAMPLDPARHSKSRWSVWSLLAEACESENWGSLTTVSRRVILLAVLDALATLLLCFSMSGATVTVCMILSQSSCTFVILISAVFYCRIPGALQIASVGATMAGIVVVGLASEAHAPHSGSTSTIGIVFCISFSAATAVYHVIWAEKVGSGGKVKLESILTMLGLMGICTILLLWPTLWLFEALNAFGIEVAGVPSKFQWPSDRATWLSLISVALTGLAVDLCIVGGVSLTSALYMCVGAVLCVPVSGVTDWLLRGTILSWGQMLGAGLILVGFFIFMLHEKRKEEHEANQSLVDSYVQLAE